jgi:hypothetical protein
MELLLRTRRGFALLLFCAFALLNAAAARALPIALVEQDRAVATEASASALGLSDADADADSTTAAGHAGLSVSSLAVAGDLAIASPAAEQSSELSEAAVAGYGLVDVGAFGTSPDAFALASADTRLRIVFTPTADATLRLTGHLEAHGAGPGTASALLEISALDSSVDPLLLLYEVDEGGVESLDVDVLVPVRSGVEYRLLALARLGTDPLGIESGTFVASFRFELTEVPEPATALILTLGLALLTKLRPPLPA